MPVLRVSRRGEGVERWLVEIFWRLVRRAVNQALKLPKVQSADRVQPLPPEDPLRRRRSTRRYQATLGQDTKDARASKRFTLPHVPCISTHAHVAARISIARRCNNKQHALRESHDMAVVAMSTKCKLHAAAPHSGPGTATPKHGDLACLCFRALNPTHPHLADIAGQRTIVEIRIASSMSYKRLC
jgi:hypothetical protein